MSITPPNDTLITEIELSLSNISKSIQNSSAELKVYLELLREEKVEEKVSTNSTIETLKGKYERLNELMRKNEILNIKINETSGLINTMIKLIDKIIKTIGVDKKQIIVKNNEIIDLIIKLEEKKENEQILQNPKDKKQLKDELEEKKKLWIKKKIGLSNKKKEVQKVISKPFIQKTIKVEDKELVEMKQLEGWTKMKIGNVLFDSDKDNWKDSTIFKSIVMFKRNLIFLIEDNEGNLFGGFANVVIDKCNSYLKDPKSFVFSLRSNGRLNGLVKFDIVSFDSAINVCDGTQNWLFIFGYGCDICIFTENNKNESYSKQSSFNYNGIENALCGKSYPDKFTPKRIKVIQLI